MKKILTGALLLFGAACATNPGVVPSRAEVVKLSEGEVRAVTHEPAPFVLASGAKAAVGGLFGIVGGVIAANSMQRAGQAMVAEYSVPDPSLAVRERLAAALSEQFSLRVTPDTAPVGDSVAELRTKFGSGAVLDTRTLNWQLLYYASDPRHHYLLYAGRARLVRLSDNKVLWQNRCLIKLQDPKGSRPTVDEYRAGNGELLKQKVQEAANRCADQLIAHLQTAR